MRENDRMRLMANAEIYTAAEVIMKISGLMLNRNRPDEEGRVGVGGRSRGKNASERRKDTYCRYMVLLQNDLTFLQLLNHDIGLDCERDPGQGSLRPSKECTHSHSVHDCHMRRLRGYLSVVFNTPPVLVDVAVCIFLKMCLIGIIYERCAVSLITSAAHDGAQYARQRRRSDTPPPRDLTHAKMSESETKTAEVGFIAGLLEELTSPLNLVLTFLILYLVYRILKSDSDGDEGPPPPPPMAKLRKDMTVDELRKYDGTQADGRVLLALNGTIFDVTKGKRFYGPGGPYAAFAGRDATRGLATGNVEGSDKDYDDLSDLQPDEIQSAKDWEEQFKVVVHSWCFIRAEVVQWLRASISEQKVMDSILTTDGLTKLKLNLNQSVRVLEGTLNRRFWTCRGINDDSQRYDIVGKLLKPGEQPKKYSETEE
ncbi:Membrane-associated progesterone receptor component 1 [Eumeta japonica]|uniref:Membrane-associated progesterone receptor component 1 n=1 Tax=Eumeta variegata TaxID=151549 RepID=A0A4C1SY80_EUMVA|nr:Membrane-associated progesterone receptor component 1 [Eumeta japonica]